MHRCAVDFIHAGILPFVHCGIGLKGQTGQKEHKIDRSYIHNSRYFYFSSTSEIEAEAVFRRILQSLAAVSGKEYSWFPASAFPE